MNENSLRTLEQRIQRAQQLSMRPIQRARGLGGRRRVARKFRSLQRGMTVSAGGAAGVAMKPWSRYFPFESGTVYEVKSPTRSSGSGEVLERTDGVLRLSLDMPAHTAQGNGSMPASQIMLEISYRQEGAGNLVRLTRNGNTYEDGDARITSDDSARRRMIRLSSPFREYGLTSVGVSAAGTDEATLRFKVNGTEHIYDLKRQAVAASGPALAAGRGLVRARDAGAVVAGVALGANVLGQIVNAEGDITWNLEVLKGSYHPHHDQWSADERARFGAGPWLPKTEEVHVAMSTVSTAEISATFQLSFQYNGYYIANVDLEPVRTNDLILWGVHVTGRVIKDANELWTNETNQGPLAHISYSLNYRFAGSVYEDKIFVARYELYGNGDLGWSRRWTQ